MKTLISKILVIKCLLEGIYFFIKEKKVLKNSISSLIFLIKIIKNKIFVLKMI